MDNLYDLSFVKGMLKIALECAENNADGLALELVNEESGFRMKFRIEEMNEVNECINRIYGAKEDE